MSSDKNQPFTLKIYPKKKFFASLHCPVSRSSRPKVFCKEGVLRNFAKFIDKHLCQGLFYNKVTGPRRATLLKKRLLHRCFPVEFSKFLRIPFLKKHLQCLLLYFLCYIKFRTSIYFDFCGLLLDFFLKSNFAYVVFIHRCSLLYIYFQLSLPITTFCSCYMVFAVFLCIIFYIKSVHHFLNIKDMCLKMCLTAS